ncbi:MAG: alpha/beta fold hydrolase [Pseudomonadales bacterium]|jgi:polyhydroxyalkanoate synthase|nr:alpha/beta fold hydrolase [Pseudomonadales bacterium]MDP6472769.1 alpha/beta fold hydrolase [Pseudomonadales bacterium]MDP6827982.1 alpha/beta fold hydrolase [Pseudomonadales bacterium]MDP6972881.1 alpha/beta fold hydrolase [Pseudomonadales bacterium]
MSNSNQQAKEDLGTRVQAMVKRAIQRNVKGLEFISAPKAPVGLTPKDIIYKRGTLRLYHYHPLSHEVYRVPVLLVMATTNKAFVFDLAPGQSMVEYLLKSGFDVFVIDWEPPTIGERGLTLEDYTQDFIPACVDKVNQTTGEPDLSIIGYCAGGMLSTIYAATHTDGPLKNLVCLTTPINFHAMGLTQVWQDKRYFDVDRLVDTLGIIPADIVTQGFEMQRPAQRIAGQLRVWEQMWNDEFVKSFRAFERWGNETLPLPGEYMREMTKELLWDNKLYKGELRAGGKVANLANIEVPVLSVVAEHDHLVPFEASKPLLELVGSDDKEEILLNGGHVSLIAGPNAIRRMWPRLNAWLSERSV